MKQRITYLQHDPANFDKNQITVQSDSLSVARLNAAKEHRLTIGLDELPGEIAQTLRQCHELHIRWTRPQPYPTIIPLVSRTSPGLHVFFTPHPNRKPDQLCPTLKKLFSDDLKCETPEKSFTRVPILSERFSMSAEYQHHQLVPSLANLIMYLQAKVCSGASFDCIKSASLLESASYIDIDYDTISHALTLNTFWSSAPTTGTWTEEIRLPSPSSNIEVGILNAEEPLEPEEHRIGGFLTILGEDTKPSTTLFSFPSRHHPLPSSSTYRVSFRHPTGLHPTLQLHLSPSALLPPRDPSTCALHTYLSLPSPLFLDKYQLSDPLFLASQNLSSLRALAGESDLEAPDYVIEKWGSASLLEVAVPGESSPNTNPNSNSDIPTPEEALQAAEHTISIPLHLRYLTPNTLSHEPVAVAWPHVFWACTAEEGTKMSNNPFDRVHVGYDGLFGPRTMFFHVNPEAAGTRALVETVMVPVLSLGAAEYVRWGTVGAVVLGFGWVVWKLGVVALGRGGQGGRERGKKTQ